MNDFKIDEAIRRATIGAEEPSAVLAARHSAIRCVFHETADRLGWTLLTRGRKSIESRRSRTFVLGVVLWSMSDLAALDDLAGVCWIREQGIPVEVFDLDACLTVADVALFVPGVPPITRTPILAEYENFQLLQTWVGTEVSRWCREVSRCDPRVAALKSSGTVAAKEVGSGSSPSAMSSLKDE